MLTFNNFTTATRVHILVPVEINTFGGISLIAAELNQVESQRKRTELVRPKFEFPKNRGYQLLSFEVRSPPVVVACTDPSWLAVYIALMALGVTCIQLLGSYSNVKKEAKELAKDLGGLKLQVKERINLLVDAIQGLSDEQKAEIVVGAMLYFEYWKERTEDVEKLLWRATRFASILGRREHSPDLRAEPQENDNDG